MTEDDDKKSKVDTATAPTVNIVPPEGEGSNGNVDQATGGDPSTNLGAKPKEPSARRRSSTAGTEVAVKLYRRIAGLKSSITPVLAGVIDPKIVGGVSDRMSYGPIRSAVETILQQLTKIQQCVDQLTELEEVTEEKLGQLLVYSVDIKSRLYIVEDLVEEHKSMERKPVKITEERNTVLASGVAARLPVLELLKFKGMRNERYDVFWQSFEASIGSRTDLSELVKFQYLKSAVQGDALAAIQHLTVSAGSYEKATIVLDEKFNRPYLQQQMCIKALLDLAGWQKCHSLESMIRLYDHIARQLDILTSMGVSIDNISLAVKNYTLKLLPERVVYKFLDTDTEGSLEDLLHLMKRSIDLREKREAVVGQERKEVTSSGGRPVRTVFAATRQPEVSLNAENCCICFRPGHLAVNCVKHVDLQEMLRLTIGRCHNCFVREHRRDDCREAKNCRKCDDPRKHHGKLCRQPDVASQEI